MCCGQTPDQLPVGSLIRQKSLLFPCNLMTWNLSGTDSDQYQTEEGGTSRRIFGWVHSFSGGFTIILNKTLEYSHIIFTFARPNGHSSFHQT